MSESPRNDHLFLVGAAAGLAAGDLFLGLNPALLEPWHAVRLLGGCGMAGLLLAAPVALARPRTGGGRLVWWARGGVAAGYGLFVESQRQLHYLFIGNGARRLLVATTIAASLVALACAGAALRKTGVTAPRRIAWLAVLLFALVPLAARRAPEQERLSTPARHPQTPSRGLLVIGLEGASWELLTSGASDGSLPVFARLLKDGVSGPLGTISPYDRDPVWISAATGKRPSKHGVVSGRKYQTPLGPMTLLPRLIHGEPLERFPFSPVARLGGEGRSSLTFWEIVASRGHEAVVLNWPAAPTRAGLLLWTPESAFGPGRVGVEGMPGNAADRAALFRLAGSLGPALSSLLEPAGLSAEDRDRARAREAAARDLSVAAEARASLPAASGSVSTLVLSGLAGPARAFGPSATPSRYWGVAAGPADARSRALLGYYRFLDELVGRLLERGGKDRTVCVFSPVGYGPRPAREALLALATGSEPKAAPDPSHSGFVVLVGSGLRAGARLTSATLFDLAPTLLALAGEPVARDFDGRVLAEAFDERFSETTSIPIVVSFEPGGPQ
jgi:hypothetical protein